MADPSHPFVLTLMTWVFKEESFCTLITNSFFSQTYAFRLLLSFFFSNTHTHFLRLSLLTMSPVKSQGSSYRRGKAIASDSPAIPDVGEEMERSDSERSAKEETQRDPDSECAPLIDPWYEVNPHFPKIPGDYVPPPPGRVLIALVRRNPDVSWALICSIRYSP